MGSRHARAAVPELPDAADWPAAREELRRLRLALGLTYGELGELIARLVPMPNGESVPGVTLRKLLTQAAETPRERLLYRLVNALPGLREQRAALTTTRRA